MHCSPSLAATAAASPWIGIWPLDQQSTKNLFAGLAFDQFDRRGTFLICVGQVRPRPLGRTEATACADGGRRPPHALTRVGQPNSGQAV